jgi:hypothetical protein
MSKRGQTGSFPYSESLQSLSVKLVLSNKYQERSVCPRVLSPSSVPEFPEFPSTNGVQSGKGTYICPDWRLRPLSKNTFPQLAAAIFLIVAVAHALRLIFKWVVLIGGWQVPMWVSAVAIVITAYLAYEGFRISQSKQIR